MPVGTSTDGEVTCWVQCDRSCLRGEQRGQLRHESVGRDARGRALTKMSVAERVGMGARSTASTPTDLTKARFILGELVDEWWGGEAQSRAGW